ncbi:chorismate lyase [Vulcanococcus sp.]|uniref:chorismate lyase n=1 Tax=Vulcanococcus sp. TaxID=2856995 RepID=UPI003F69921A
MPPTKLWPSPLPLWQAPSEAVAAGLCGQLDGERAALSGPWRLLLLGDGSPTRHLQSLTGLAVEVEVIAMEADADPSGEAPVEVEELDRPLLRRQVWLRCGTQTLAWAESWWNQTQADRHLQERSQPIWRSLTANRAELYREVDGLALVQAPALAAGFGRPGPYWSRHYRFFRGGRELTVIREVFSPALERWLGPAQHTASLQIPTKDTSGYN